MKIKTFAAIAFMAILSIFQFSSCTSNDVDLTQYTDNTELWPAYSNGKYGYINRKGTFVIPAQYDYASSFSCGYAMVHLNGRGMFIAPNGKLQNTPSFDYACDFWNNYAIVTANGQYGLLDKNFEYALQPIYYSISGAGRNGLVPVQLSKGDKWGYRNTQGENKIPAIHDDADPFVGDYASVQVGDCEGIINSNGEYIIQPIFYSVRPLGNNRFLFYTEHRYTDNTGIVWHEPDGCGLLDEKGQIVLNSNIYRDFCSDVQYVKWSLLPAINNSEKVGYLDKDGNVVISFQFDEAYIFNEGYACVTLNDIDMIIDEKGTIVLQLAKGEHFATGFIHNGLTLTQKNDTYYYKDIKGNVIYTWTEPTSPNAPNAPARENRNYQSLREKNRHARNPLIYYLGKE
ncbi:MAG: WG repeat-containing protein [Paludibacteraceae bacterium]|nr:WG repeat-containing protein [Paludibacteraceae bacterium]